MAIVIQNLPLGRSTLPLPLGWYGNARADRVPVSCAGSALVAGVLGTSTSATTAMSYAAALSVPTGTMIHATDDVWASESLQMAEKDAYASIGNTTAGTHKLSSSYLSTAKADAKLRVALAGARLSYLIQQNLR